MTFIQGSTNMIDKIENNIAIFYCNSFRKRTESELQRKYFRLNLFFYHLLLRAFFSISSGKCCDPDLIIIL